jgi:uncharacterized membrane-anchored protein
MKQTTGRRKTRLATVFDTLTEPNKEYIETLTAQLSEIHRDSPEKRTLTGKKAKNILQQSKTQDN